MPLPEISGVSIVVNGAFNPAVFQPKWLADKGLLSPESAQHANEVSGQQPLLISPQITNFAADWLLLQVRQEQMVIATMEVARDAELRDFAVGVMNLLPETPVDAIGINAEGHFRAASEHQWHAFGDRFLPKEPWEELVPDGDWLIRDEGKRVGLNSVYVEVRRGGDGVGGSLVLQVAPSVRVTPNGIYCSINGHFVEPTTTGNRGSAGEYGLLLAREWSEARRIEREILEKIGDQI